ncbi:type II toxin-antitoxin system VapC family toxin [Arachnia propionica]|uniref:type II toxin-antitoxin system VapC family toxin n=1 Tax=Arachnia propionica TaxID=1750 RepID=UPI003C6EB429
MIVDSSALVALILQEPGHQKIGRVLRTEDKLHMSAATWVELGVVADRRLSEANQRRLDAMIDGLGIVLVPLSAAQARRARQAHRRYGPGSGTLARLNMGDCFSYALAIELDEPLLFVGDDFTHTDVRQVDLDD